MFDLLLDLIYPLDNSCLNCGEILFLEEIEGLCTECLKDINFNHISCQKCGRALSDRKNRICRDCIEKTYFFDQARSVAVYGDEIKKLLFNFKYKGEKRLARPLADLLYLYFCEFYNNLSIEVILPVPLHKKRKQKRGFNQAELLGKKISKKCKIPLITDILVREKETPPLYKLDYYQRQTVIKNAFIIDRYRLFLKKKSVLIIDDIFTTGSTVNEIAFILKKVAKVKKVFVLTLASGEI